MKKLCGEKKFFEFFPSFQNSKIEQYNKYDQFDIV